MGLALGTRRPGSPCGCAREVVRLRQDSKAGGGQPAPNRLREDRGWWGFCDPGKAEAYFFGVSQQVFEGARFIRLVFFAGLATCMPGSKAATLGTKMANRIERRPPDEAGKQSHHELTTVHGYVSFLRQPKVRESSKVSSLIFL